MQGNFNRYATNLWLVNKKNLLFLVKLQKNFLVRCQIYFYISRLLCKTKIIQNIYNTKIKNINFLFPRKRLLKHFPLSIHQYKTPLIISWNTPLWSFIIYLVSLKTFFCSARHRIFRHILLPVINNKCPLLVFNFYYK